MGLRGGQKIIKWLKIFLERKNEQSGGFRFKGGKIEDQEGDMTRVYNIMHGVAKVDTENIFSLSHNTRI